MKTEIFTLLLMILMHFVADFMFQSDWMANAKQKDWWEKEYPNKLYKNDYIAVLVAHSFIWTFFIMLPMYFITNQSIIMYCSIFIANLILHIFIDNEKANVKLINLWQDQSFHLIQIFLTWWFLNI